MSAPLPTRGALPPAVVTGALARGAPHTAPATHARLYATAVRDKVVGLDDTAALRRAAAAARRARAAEARRAGRARARLPRVSDRSPLRFVAFAPVIRSLCERLLADFALLHRGVAQLRKLWRDYAQSLCPRNIDTVAGQRTFAERIVRGEWVGALVRVHAASRCAALVGVCGTLVSESRNAIRVLTRENSVRLIPKQHVALEFYCGRDAPVIRVYPDQLQMRSAERTTRKLKQRPIIDVGAEF